MRVIDWIPRTKYTEGIPGGKESFWGYSLNRLVCVLLRWMRCPATIYAPCAHNTRSIFNMTEFKKIIYMDTDTLVLKVRHAFDDGRGRILTVFATPCPPLPLFIRTSTTLLRTRPSRPPSRTPAATGTASPASRAGCGSWSRTSESVRHGGGITGTAGDVLGGWHSRPVATPLLTSHVLVQASTCGD